MVVNEDMKCMPKEPEQNVRNFLMEVQGKLFTCQQLTEKLASFIKVGCAPIYLDDMCTDCMMTQANVLREQARVIAENLCLICEMLGVEV